MGKTASSSPNRKPPRSRRPSRRPDADRPPTRPDSDSLLQGVASLEIQLIGAFEVHVNGRSVKLPSRAAQSLLAFLVLNAGKPFRREKLAGMFWPESSEQRARASLRHELWRIRKALEVDAAAGPVAADDLSVSFKPPAHFKLDVEHLERLDDSASADQLAEALRPCCGELLPGFYEDWIAPEREHVRQLLEQHLARLLQLLAENQRWPEVIEWAERSIAGESRVEDSFRHLITAHLAMGDRPKALAVLSRYELAAHESGAEPSAELLALLETRAPTNNLPAPLTSFIGRERERSEVAELLGTSRLVTLTGSSGVGKTRLAIEVARDVAARFPDGVWFLPLETVQEPRAVLSSLCSILRVHAPADGGAFSILPVEVFFGTRRSLLIVDNCEHLIDTCARLASLLVGACPGLHILATSRETLRVELETAYRVPSLESPDPDQLASPADLSRYAAVRLFVERCAAHLAGFSLNAANARSVSRICAHLDGIPLALELAAGRIGGLSLENIADRLDDRFALLTGGSRTELPRHQTLRATVDWSHDLLSSPEKVLFRRLAIFSGGWTLEAAQAVAGTDECSPSQVLELLPELVKKSLVDLHPARQRYSMLETMRLYAMERLNEAGEMAALRTQHLDYFAEFAGAQEAPMITSEAEQMRLVAEHENILAAIKHCETAEGGVQKAMWLLGFARMNWFVLYRISEGYRLGRQYADHPEAAVRNGARQRVLLLLAMAGFMLGHGPATLKDIDEAVSICREMGDADGLTRTLHWLGILTAAFRDRRQGLQLLDEALLMARQAGMTRVRATIQSDLAEVLRAAEKYSAAESLYAEAADTFRAAANYHDLMLVLNNLVSVTIQMVELPRARVHLLEVLGLIRVVPYLLTSAHEALLPAAGYFAAAGHPQEAALLYGLCQQRMRAGGMVVNRGDRSFLEPLMREVETSLGPLQYQAAVSKGAGFTLEDAIDQTSTWLASQP